MTDTGFRPPAVTVSETDGAPRRQGVQELEFPPGAVTVSGSKATIALDLIPNHIDTKANILGSTPSTGNWMFSSDTLELFFADGSYWYLSPFRFVLESSNPDMGYTQRSNRIGIASDYITDKLLANCQVGSNANTTKGSLRVSAGILQVYLNGAWNDVIVNFAFREDSSFGYTLEHQPVGFTTYIEIMSGDSLSNIGLNGLPIVQGYKVSIGAYPFPQSAGGRTI